MKKLFLFIVVFTCGARCETANAQVFKEGDNLISVGYGFGIIDIAEGDLSGLGGTYPYENFTGPIYLKYEHALSDRMTIGINAAYAQYVYGDNYSSSINNNEYTERDTYKTFSILARLNWHFGHTLRFDPYWGFGLGYKTMSETYSSTDPNANYGSTRVNIFPLGLETTIGARYYISENIAAYIETGIAKSVVQIGLTYKLK